MMARRTGLVAPAIFRGLGGYKGTNGRAEGSRRTPTGPPSPRVLLDFYGSRWREPPGELNKRRPLSLVVPDPRVPCGAGGRGRDGKLRLAGGRIPVYMALGAREALAPTYAGLVCTK